LNSNLQSIGLLISALLSIIVVTAANSVLAKLFKAVTNVESVFITALILALIIPVKYPGKYTVYDWASIFAMAAKYFLTIEKRHLFNPAASFRCRYRFAFAGACCYLVDWNSHNVAICFSRRIAFD